MLLAEGLKNNTTLTMLNLAGSIRKKDVPRFMERIIDNKTLTKIEFEGS